MKCFVVGQGEVGTAVATLLRSAHDVIVYDSKTWSELPDLVSVESLHICIPYVNESQFFDACNFYIAACPNLRCIIVHSTVPVGTCRKLSPHACHAPVHGVHPNLVQGLRTFPQYLGRSVHESSAVAAYAVLSTARFGGFITIPDHVVQDRVAEAIYKIANTETTELLKLCCTLQYGWNIIAEKAIHALCQQYGADYNVVYGWNSYYNIGYERLGKPEVRRPHLRHFDGPIGGHCVVPNAKLLPGPMSEFLLEFDNYLRTGKPPATAALEAENADLRLRLLSAAGDDLCRLSQDEIKQFTSGEVQIPPKEEFLPSCEQFWEQVAGKAGVLNGCLTLAQLIAENEKARRRIEELTTACVKQNEEICQTLGKALGYPWFKDDQKNFPGTIEADGVCVGEHVAETIAEEAAMCISRLEAEKKLLEHRIVALGG